MEASSRPQPGPGWASFAGMLILLVGTFNVIHGLVGLVSDDYFVADELLFADLSFWGVVFLVFGLLQIVTALLIFAGNTLGAVLGIMFAFLNAIGQLLAIGAYPIWSIIILVIDGLVIYALTVYGDALRAPSGAGSGARPGAERGPATGPPPRPAG